jgi:hypothetical protein
VSVASVDQRRLQAVEQALTLYGLEKLYPIWLERNTGVSNSYHGQQHLAVVALHAHRLATEYLTTAREAVELLLSGLYHDYDHTGDPTIPDAKNVAQAVTAWESVAVELQLDDLLAPVARLIEVTEHSAKPLTIQESILRESDYAYVLEPDLEAWYKRLSDELGIMVTDESTRDYLSKLELRYLEVPKLSANRWPLR